jgi:hypothetical protein
VAALLYTLVLNVMGLSKTQESTWGRAAAALLAPGCALTCFFGVGIGWLIAFLAENL